MLKSALKFPDEAGLSQAKSAAEKGILEPKIGVALAQGGARAPDIESALRRSNCLI